MLDLQVLLDVLDGTVAHGTRPSHRRHGAHGLGSPPCASGACPQFRLAFSVTIAVS